MNCRLPKEFDYQKTYYKIIGKDIVNNTIPYCDSEGSVILNQEIKGVFEEKTHFAFPAGLYFTDKFNIVTLFSAECYIAEIKIPSDAKISLEEKFYLYPQGDCYRTDKIIIAKICDLNEYVFPRTLV